jgi:hypothetical protein
MDAQGAVGDAARLGDRDEKLEIDQIEMHGDSLTSTVKPSLRANGRANARPMTGSAKQSILP